MPVDSQGFLGVLVLAALVALIAIVVSIAVRGHLQRRLVLSESLALRELLELNERAAPHVADQEAITSKFGHRLDSKARFDRFDLSRFLSDSVLEYEQWYEREIGSRLRAVELYSAYQVSVEKIRLTLGSSGTPRLRSDRFALIESGLFEKHQLSRPEPQARISAVVNYTSPQGRNSYFRRMEWGFDELCGGLQSAQAIRAKASTAEALRARERRMMTSALRADILRRDGYRCKMCGASRDEGVNLHVDHILPVSHGGRTVKDNLQTLCQPCNLGKSNRFVG
jgi:hypothetical protein